MPSWRSHTVRDVPTEAQWYRDQVNSVDDLVAGSPIVEVFFDMVLR
jgi:hypothetical protein